MIQFITRRHKIDDIKSSCFPELSKLDWNKGIQFQCSTLTLMTYKLAGNSKYEEAKIKLQTGYLGIHRFGTEMSPKKHQSSLE